MTKDEALKLALDALESGLDTQIGLVAWTEYDSCLVFDAIVAIKEALTQPEQEPVKIIHKHEWFKTGEMKVGQMRCMTCGAWAQQFKEPSPIPLITDEEWEELNKEDDAIPPQSNT
jgi:hypothetical protein